MISRPATASAASTGGGDAAEIAGLDEGPSRHEVTVPPAVLEHRQHHPRLCCRPDQLPPLGLGTGERLVDNDSDTRRDRRMGQISVHPIRSGDDHEFEVSWRRPDLFGRVE
jgi:hypothetical protein